MMLQEEVIKEYQGLLVINPEFLERVEQLQEAVFVHC